MHFTVCSILLLLLVGPVSSMPVPFCQNTHRQIENILNLLQTIRKAATGTSSNVTKLDENETILNTDQCALIQRLSNYQACDLDLSPEIKELHYMKTETKGLVENLQSSPIASCVLSPAVCPCSHLPMWKKIIFLLNSWSQDVAACNNALRNVCSSSNYNSV
ncbi:uncharacterized protein LOC108262803 [Ictalurus punctatus]|uniref:Uncharacterized protein LOC108262803 n=1 Tax=Ictalurus punctatus TaxID=7998 RepID=A0A2D0QK78_ICTPU|nr:uncharacterized protein LOC108262803 [Ictalurus punctatus]